MSLELPLLLQQHAQLLQTVAAVKWPALHLRVGSAAAMLRMLLTH